MLIKNSVATSFVLESVSISNCYAQSGRQMLVYRKVYRSCGDTDPLRNRFTKVTFTMVYFL